MGFFQDTWDWASNTGKYRSGLTSDQYAAQQELYRQDQALKQKRTLKKWKTDQDERTKLNTPTQEEKDAAARRNTSVNKLTPKPTKHVQAVASATKPTIAKPTKEEGEKNSTTKTGVTGSSAGVPTIKPSDQQQPLLELNTNLKNRNIVEGTSTSQVFDINSFRSELITNDVLPSHSFLVTFSPFRLGFPENQPLTDFIKNKRNTLVLRCESVTLPTPTLLKEEDIRRYGYGPVEKVAYGVQFSDISMSWIVDSKSEIIDFMHQWMNTIVSYESPNTNMAQSLEYRDNLAGYSPFEVGYKDAYSNPIVRVYVYNRQNQTVTEYEMYDVFPQNIQTINLAWANENEIQKLNVTFAYTSMRMKAPLKTTTEQLNYILENRINPNEERVQPKDKGGQAARDRLDAPINESITSSSNASNPNATESNRTLSTTGSTTPQPIVRTFTS